MKIAVINEISAAARNADILKALEGRGTKSSTWAILWKAIRPVYFTSIPA